ncbi:MAG: SLC13 family permease, partial [Bacillota bacterium]
MNAVLRFIKKEPVLVGALILTVVTCFFVPPNLEYIDYINFETLARLFGLMLIIKAMSRIRAFQIVASKILPRLKTSRGLVTALVLIPTFFSLFITNDVAIVTFVPFAIIVLSMCDKSHLILKTVILITIGCNLAGFISPLGNSQNLYLFAYYDLPSTYLIQNAYITFLAGMGLLLLFCLTTKKEKIESFEDKKREIKKGK